MKKYNITGMSCAACSARVEKAVNAVEGVTSCNVSLLTNSMGVEGPADAVAVIKAVIDAGYGACEAEIEFNSTKEKNDSIKDRETPVLIRRFVSSLGFLLVLMYFSMGHSMFGWPLPAVFDQNPVFNAFIQLVLSGIILVINRKFFISGFKGIIHYSPNMDSLVALGSGVSFGWSVYVLFNMACGKAAGPLYFESAAMILVLITVGKTLEAYSKGKTTNALKSLMDLSPETANLLIDGKEVKVEVEQVKEGDIFTVRPGESIPVDGEVIEGNSAVNEAALTGESVPVDKEPGSKVSSGTINTSGFLKCRALKVGKETTLSQIIQMVSDAAATKAPIAKIADKVSGVFVPVVITIAAITAFIWIVTGADAGYALERGIAVLVISCPCALGLATPVAIMVANGKGARNGILFKTSASLEETGRAKIVVLDKTGTVTEGNPVVTDILCAEGVEEKDLLRYAVSLESKSEHPLAKAVVTYGKETEIQETTDFEALPGNGLKAKIDGKTVFAGKETFVETQIQLDQNTKAKIDYFTQQGKTPLLFALENRLLGLIVVADVIKKDSKQAVEQLKNLNLSVYLVTGDNEKTAKAVADQAGITNIVADVLPGDKAAVIKELQKHGKVIMVGDGINDAPALTQADTGIAIGSGTDVAIDAADVVLMNSSLMDVVAAVKLSRKTIMNIYQNLFWAFIYNVIGIPLAAGAFIRLFGWQLKPMFGAAAMSLSSFCVITNALRLNFVNLKEKINKTKERDSIESKENKMTKTLKVEGMMCSHCEAHVKKALEAVDGVKEAVTSHEKGTAVITLLKEVDSAVLSKAVEEAGYKVTGEE